MKTENIGSRGYNVDVVNSGNMKHAYYFFGTTFAITACTGDTKCKNCAINGVA